VITNFGTLGRTISISHLFLQLRLPSSNNIFFKETMATKNIASQASKKSTASLSRRSCQADTIPKRRVHGMETRTTAKVAKVVVVRKTVTPSPKQQDLWQKVSS